MYKEKGLQRVPWVAYFSFNAQHHTPYELDFGAMTLTKCHSKRVRLIRRRGGDEDTHLLNFAAAAARRKVLMAERKFFIDEGSKEVLEREFSLCEH